jgi:hypothetical protein
VLWAVCAVVVIGAGLPLAAWLTTRGLARRPPAPLKPYHGRIESWIHSQYKLGWTECSLIHNAVTQGRRVSDPGLEDAAHRLAAATLRGKVPGTRVVRVAAGMNLILGPAMAGLGIALFFCLRMNSLPCTLFSKEYCSSLSAGSITYSVLGDNGTTRTAP